MELIEKNNDSLVFRANIDESVANAIRRYLGQVPVLAVEEVDISKNDSSLYDETIAHRIGLIPLKTEKSMKEGDKIKMKLAVDREGYVYSGDFTGGAEVIYKNIPITSLSKGQSMEIVAEAVLGKGSEHSKFSPGLMFYRNISEIAMGKEFLEDVKRLCPNATIKEKGDKLIITDDKKEEIGDICEGICEKIDKSAEVTPQDELAITLESFGQMSVDNIFKSAIDFLKKDLAGIAKKL